MMNVLTAGSYWLYQFVVFMMMLQNVLSAGGRTGVAIGPPSVFQNWFIRSDGGTRYDVTRAPSGQCNGKFDTSYASTGGVGVNQNCAFNDFRYMWQVNDGTGGQGTWIASGGDTVVIRGCNALASQQNPDNPHCRLGYDNDNNGNFPNSWCPLVGNNDCNNPPIPAGTAAHHTRIIGGCAFGTYTCTNITFANYPFTGNNLTQIFAGFGLRYSFMLLNTSYVDVEGIEFTTHNGVCTHGGSGGFPPNPITGLPTSPAGCSTVVPYGPYADNGVTFNHLSSNIFLQDVYIHGFAASGLKGEIGGIVTLNRVFSGFNGHAGWDFDNGNIANAAGSQLLQTFIIMMGNGCYEQYPISNTTFSAGACFDDISGGFGDAWSGQDSNIDNITCDHCTTIYNTKDGWIGPHTSFANQRITNSIWYGNMGQALKLGGQINSTNLVQNNLIEGNCFRMTVPPPGAVQNFNQSTGLVGSYLTDFCRAGGNIMDTLTQIGSVNHYYGNTFVINATNGLQFDCGPAGGGATNCNTVITEFTDNIFLTYDDPGLGSNPTLYTINAGTNITLTTTYAIEIGANGQDPCGGTIHCTSPLLISQPTLPWPGSQTAFDNFNFKPSGASPAIGAGLTIAGMTTDYAGVTRPNPPTLGGLEP